MRLSDFSVGFALRITVPESILGVIGLYDDSDTPTIDWLPLDIDGRQRTRNALDCGIHCTRNGSLRKSWDVFGNRREYYRTELLTD
jgi:hypothetical protein